MKKIISLSINPSYLCNFRCDFCYLSPEQLSDSKVASLRSIKKCLEEISLYRKIEMIDLYGGEISMLKEDYLDSLLKLIGSYYSGKVNLTTNLRFITKIIKDPNIYPTISWDREARESHEVVYRNMQKLDKQFSVSMLVSHKMASWDENKVIQIIRELNELDNLVSFELKPYSKNQANSFENVNSVYCKTVSYFIKNNSLMNFTFVNEDKIKNVFSGINNSFSDDHLYINPDGKFAVLDFDENDREYFLKLDNYIDYISWYLEEKQKVILNERCASCKYQGNCLSEHLRPSDAKEAICSGFKPLLDNYASRL